MNTSYYAVIPAPVLYSKDLTNFQKLLYANISALTNKDGYCFASNEYFSDLFGTTIETISRAISGIAKAGFVMIEIDKKAGNVRKIYLSEQIPLLTKKSIGIDKNINTPIDKKVNNNNIVINSTNNTNIDKSILERKKKSSIEILKDEQVLSDLKKQFGPGVDMEVEKAIDYISARGKRYKDYVAFMRNWMRNRHKYENKPVAAPGVDYKAREQAQNYKPAAPANNMHLI